MSNPRALVIDDEPDIRELLSMTLNRMDIDSDAAEDITSAKRFLSKSNYNICLTDMKLPDGNGIDLVKYIQKHHSNIPVAVITAHGNMDTAVLAMKAGAFDFVNKPIDLTALRKLVSSAIASSQLENQGAIDSEIIGHSEPIKSLKRSIQKLARSQAPVYISGESGSGKELVARSIHKLGPRSEKPFVPVNCGAIPKELVESEFFGHKKGSFTGATQEKQGLFQAAEGGTLFLDEVADLPLDMQVKLLRAIQEKAVRPVGAHTEIPIDTRILCATHKNLEELVASGDFRQDLFYRINVIQIPVPSLRQRNVDLPQLTKYILRKLTAGLDIPCPTVSSEAMAALKNYHFPGNIRELENILERAYTLSESSEIQLGDLQLSEGGPRPLTDSVKANKKQSYYSMCLEYPSIDEYLNEIEKEILCETLENARWNKTLAAKKLGISFRSLRYRLSKLGLSDEE